MPPNQLLELPIGLFVDAEIEGRGRSDVYVLPRDALRSGERVFVVDDEGRLRFRDIELLRTTRDQIVVGQGLAPGERVLTSALDAAIDGMAVRIADDGSGAPASQQEADAEPGDTLADREANP